MEYMVVANIETTDNNLSVLLITDDINKCYRIENLLENLPHGYWDEIENQERLANNLNELFSAGITFMHDNLDYIPKITNIKIYQITPTMDPRIREEKMLEARMEK